MLSYTKFLILTPFIVYASLDAAARSATHTPKNASPRTTAAYSTLLPFIRIESPCNRHSAPAQATERKDDVFNKISLDRVLIKTTKMKEKRFLKEDFYDAAQDLMRYTQDPLTVITAFSNLPTQCNSADLATMLHCMISFLLSLPQDDNYTRVAAAYMNVYAEVLQESVFQVPVSAIFDEAATEWQEKLKAKYRKQLDLLPQNKHVQVLHLQMDELTRWRDTIATHKLYLQEEEKLASS